VKYKLHKNFLLLFFQLYVGVHLYGQQVNDSINFKPYLIRDVFVSKRTNIIESSVFFTFKNGNSQLSNFAFAYYRLTNKENSQWHRGWGGGLGYNRILKFNRFHDFPHDPFEMVHVGYFVSYFPSPYFSIDLGIRGVTYFAVDFQDEFNEMGWTIGPGTYVKVETGLTKLRIGATLTCALIFFEGGMDIIRNPNTYFLTYMTPVYIRYYFSR
jgi:hypothetical protein